MSIKNEATLTCPVCGHAEKLQMRSDSCQYYYQCRACNSMLKPRKGDCCVFCSYADIPCPPVQKKILGIND